MLVLVIHMSDTATVEVPAKFQSLVGEIEKMSVLDLAELVKVLEGKFGVSAAAPIAMMAAPAAAAVGEVVEEQADFTVELTASGDKKIDVIKALRTCMEIGLKDAKDLVDAAPKVIKEGVPKAQATEWKAKLETAGAKITLK